MNIIDNRKDEILIKTFENLHIGDVYEDGDGNICIKTDQNRCIFFDGRTWESISESEETEVKLLSTNLEILGYHKV